METVKVNLAERSYNIHIQEDLLKDSGEYIKDLNLGNKIFLITDRNVAKLYHKTQQFL